MLLGADHHFRVGTWLFSMDLATPKQWKELVQSSHGIMLTVLGKDQQPVGFALDNAGAVANDKVFMMDFSFFFCSFNLWILQGSLVRSVRKSVLIRGTGKKPHSGIRTLQKRRVLLGHCNHIDVRWGLLMLLHDASGRNIEAFWIQGNSASQQTNRLRIYDEDRGYLSWRWFWLTVWKSPRYGKGTIISSTTHRPIWGRERKHKESGKRNSERITAAPTPSVMQSQSHSQALLQHGRLDALSFSWCFSFFVWIYTFQSGFQYLFH